MHSMAQATNSQHQKLLLRLSRGHFVYIALYGLSIVLFDAWDLLAREAVTQRWTLAVMLLTVTTIVWYLPRLKLSDKRLYLVFIWILLIADILFAALNVYYQRGMASKAVMLFAVPIISASLLKSRSLLLSVCSLSVGAYSFAAVRYFYANYGQGYRVELYGEVGFYAALFFILAGLLLISFRPGKD